MYSDKYSKALKIIPDLLNATGELNVDFETILVELRKLFEYRVAMICYINSNRIHVKKIRKSPEIQISENDYFDITEPVKRELFKPETIIIERNSSFAKQMQLDKYNCKYVMSKLIIKNTIFGFILIGKDLDRIIEPEDKEILTSVSSVCSYAIKDSELSNVFKIQLKSLQDAILEKTYAYKIIKEQNEKILSADKIKNDFLANISHELRTPLNAIIGFSEILENQFYGKLNKKQKDYVNDIHTSGIHLLGMINEILDISKIESKAMKINISEFDLTQNLQEVANIVQPLVKKKKLQFKINFEKELIITADYQKIQQIFYNLLSNAIKFTEEKGRIDFSFTANKKTVKIIVKDSGIGIDEKYHGKIFGKFVQIGDPLTKKESSTGLGLTITKELVNLHKGKIFLESKVGEGTSFIVEIPVKYKKSAK